MCPATILQNQIAQQLVARTSADNSPNSLTIKLNAYETTTGVISFHVLTRHSNPFGFFTKTDCFG